MATILDGTKVPPHGIFYMEGAGRVDRAAASVTTVGSVASDENRPSCFALEEEQGEKWNGRGASKPPINETRPTL